MRFPPVLILVVMLPLAGCWQSETSLYRGQTPLEPVRTGKVEGIGEDGKTREQSVLTKQPGGIYRLTNDEKNSSDFGDSFVIRFFPLEGAPPGLVVFEARERKVCKPSDNMCHQDPAFYYGLARVEGDKAEVLNPDCDKDGPIAKLPGVKLGECGICTFSDHASLERALELLAKQQWQPQVTYRLKD